MTHWVDLTTEQLMKLYNALYSRRDMQDIVEKLSLHAEIVKQSK